MEDVIFAGTRDRKPLGMAYVTMTLVDPEVYDEIRPPISCTPSKAAQPKRSGEITITRRLFRSGESEYLIDGQPPACATFRTSSWAPASDRRATPSSSRAASARSSAPSRRTAAP